MRTLLRQLWALCLLLVVFVYLLGSADSSETRDGASKLPSSAIHIAVDEDLCERFANTIKPEVDLDFSWPYAHIEANQNLTVLSTCKDDLSRVEEITLHGRKPAFDWTQFAEVAEQLESLHTINWDYDAPLPAKMLDLLQERPDISLDYHLKDSNDPFQILPRRAWFPDPCAAVGGANLVRLRNAIHYDHHTRIQPLRSVHRIMSNRPNIRSLDSSMDQFGCLVNLRNPRAFNFSDPEFEGKPFPALRFLRLTGHNFSSPWKGVKGGNIVAQLQEFLADSMNRLYTNMSYLIGNFIRRPRLLWQAVDDEAGNGAYRGCNSDCGHYPLPLNGFDALLHHLDPSQLRLLTTDFVDGRSLQALLEHNMPRLSTLRLMRGDRSAVPALVKLLGSSYQFKTLELRDIDADIRWSFTPRGYFNMNTQLTEDAFHALFTKQRQLEDLTITQSSEARLYASNSLLFHAPQSLERLELDIDRNLNATDLDARLRAIGHLENLDGLILRVDSPSRSLRDSEQCKENPACSSVLGPLRDDIFNKRTIEEMFLILRATQQGYVNRRNAKLGKPSLRILEVIIGPWDERHSHAFSFPPDEWLGRYMCTYEEQNDHGECRGGLMRHPRNGRQYAYEGREGYKIMGMSRLYSGLRSMGDTVRGWS